MNTVNLIGRLTAEPELKKQKTEYQFAMFILQ